VRNDLWHSAAYQLTGEDSVQHMINQMQDTDPQSSISCASAQLTKYENNITNYKLRYPFVPGNNPNPNATLKNK